MRQSRKGAYFLLLCASTLWLALLVAPSVLGGSGAGQALSRFFSFLCHQEADRSFFWLGQSLAVCHRCSGIYLGFWAGLLTFPFLKQFSRFLLQNPRALILFFVPMLVDVVLNNSWLTRFLTGMLAGFPVSLFAWTALEQLPDSLSRFFGRSHESQWS